MPRPLVADPDDHLIRMVLLIIGGFLVLRLAAASLVGLGVDECYSLAIARHLQLSYFDHPPLHQWIIHLFSGALGYGRWARLPFVAMFAVSTWLLFDLTRTLFGGRAGLWAVIALNVSGFFSAVAGGWVLPDGPLILCLLGAATQAARILFASDRPASAASRDGTLAWLRVGLWIGLAGLSKYQAVVFGLGLGGALLALPAGRAQLRRPGPYLAALLALAIISPVIIWNAGNGWASFAYQGGRAAPAHGLRPTAALTALIGQAALLLPWVFAPLAAAGWQAARAGGAGGRTLFCLALSLPGILLFAATPLWGQSALPHWSMPAWLFLFPLLGDHLALAATNRRWPRVWAMTAFAALGVVWSALVAEAATGWIGQTWPATFAKGDPTQESVEWSALSDELAGSMRFKRADPFIIAANWREAGKIAQAVGDGVTVIVASDDPRGFGYGREIGDLVGRNALIVLRKRAGNGELDRLRPCFAALEPSGSVAFGRGGAPEIVTRLVYAQRLSASCRGLGHR